MKAARHQEEDGVVFHTVCVEDHKTGKSEREKLVVIYIHSSEVDGGEGCYHSTGVPIRFP